ncbi:MAG: 4-hydroxy-3-methylbut-2-enyl diphosphate reductase [Nitrospirae bacterium]|nr:4-hydroxy-3-methylbut-2-enyl diphosphate reductase [Nitrospirota bacterium]
MKVIVSEGAGFCFGVKRAIQLAFDTAKSGAGPVHTLGPIIHNPQVVERLAGEGVTVIDSVGGAEDGGILIIRSHGVGPSVYREIENRGLRMIDATCPFVKTAQEHARKLSEAGYQVIIVGEESHPEVRGILGYAGADAFVIGREDGIEQFSIKRKVGIIAQTTQSFENLSRVVLAVLPRVSELKVHNTICNATRQRQAEAIGLAERVDLMLVVGGKNSANTQRLKTLCEEKGVRVYHVETSDEIDDSWLEGARTVGVTGGASTPDWIISDVKKRLQEQGDR